MPKKYLQLEDTRVYYDQDTGSIRLISKDPRLKGSPFQLHLLRDSEDTESIYRLLEADGLVGDKPNELPRSSSRPEGRLSYWRTISEDERFSNRDMEGRNLRFLVGESYERQFVEINLHNAPHTLISGRPGTGKTVLLRSLTEQIAERSGTILFSVNAAHSDEPHQSQGKLRAEDRFAGDEESAVALIRSAVDEIARRYRILEERGVNYWLSLDSASKPLILAVDSFSELVRSRIHGQEIRGAIEMIARLGRAAGVYLIIAAKEIDSPHFPGELKANFGRRILLRSFDEPRYQELALGRAIGYGKHNLDGLGRASIRIYSSQIRIFQSFSPADF